MSTTKIIKYNSQALAAFNQALGLSDDLQNDGQHRPAEWFDTPEKRLQWWLDLEPQWQRAFSEAVFKEKGKNYAPVDLELEFLFDLDELLVCGNGDFAYQNNPPDISFQLTNLSGVKNLTKLKNIEFDYNGLIESLEPLKHLVNLINIWADNNRISDLSPLMGLHNLQDLCIWNNQITNLEPLAGLINLERLTLGLDGKGNPLEDIEPLKYLSNLTSLYVEGCGLTDLEALRNATKLEILSIEHNDIESIEPIKKHKIWYLRSSNNPRLKQ